MTLLYPLTHRKWLKNRENGLLYYTADEVTKAIRRINKHLTFLNKNQNSFITDSDVVNVTAKRHVYKNALLLRVIFIILFVALVIAESFINYENMEIFIMPGENGIRALLMRTVTALIITTGSIVSIHLIFETIFHSWLEEDKIRYNFPDTVNVALGDKAGLKDKNRFAFLLICTVVMLGCLLAIYKFAEKRTAVIEAASQATSQQPSQNNDTLTAPLTLVSLILPFIAGIVMFVIKRNHNIITAYKAMTRYLIKQDLDKKRKNYFIDVFSIKRARTLNEEVSITFKRVNKFKNYLEGVNYTIIKRNTGDSPYKVHGIAHTEDQNALKKFIIQRLEPETLRLANEINSKTVN